LDEIAAWVVIKDLKTCGVTSKLEVRYLKPVPTNEGQLTIRARLKEMKRNIAIIECEIVSHKNEVCSRGEISYFTYSKEQSEKLFKFEDIN
jgi:acyl-CoA thioesterase FadM